MKKVILVAILILHALCIRAQVNTDRLLRVGSNALYFSDYVLAIQYFNQIIKAKPYLEEPYLYRAFAKIMLEDYYGALSDINTVISKNEFIPRAYYARGYIYNRLKQYTDAEKDFARALEFSPDNVPYLIGKLESYDYLKRYSDELEIINLLIGKTGDPQITLEKGRVQLLLGDTLAAFGTMDSLVGSHSHLAEAWGGRAMINMIMNRNDSALADYNKAISLKSDNFTHYVNRGNLLHEKNDYSGAIADYNKAVSLAPNDEKALFNRSLIMIEIGDYNQALKDLDRILKNNPNMYEAIYMRATVSQKLGNHTAAINDLSRVIGRYPKFAPAYEARAGSYNALQKKKAAFGDMQAIIRINAENAKRHSSTKNEETDSINTDIKIADEESKISDWAKLFDVSDSEEHGNKFKDNDIRGAIQNRNVEARPKGDFVLSLYRRQKDIETDSYFSSLLNEANRKLEGSYKLYLVSEEVSPTDAIINHLFKNIDMLSGRISKEPHDFYLYLVRGIHYAIVQDLDSAVDDFSRAIDIKNDALAYFCRAVVRRKQFEVMSANMQPDDDKNRATAKPDNKKILHDVELILRDYDRAIELSADFSFAYYNRANMLTRAKDYNAAIQQYTEAIKSNPNFAEAYFNRGLTYIYSGERSKGIADLSKAGELGIYDAYNLLKKITK